MTDMIVHALQYGLIILALVTLYGGRNIKLASVIFMACAFMTGFQVAVPVAESPWAAVFAGDVSAYQINRALVDGIILAWVGGLASLILCIALSVVKIGRLKWWRKYEK